MDDTVVPRENTELSQVTYKLYQISIRYSTVEKNEAARIGYNGFLFPQEYSGESRGT